MATDNTEILKNQPVKGKNGGARPGSGRKPGGQNKATKDRAAVKQAFIDRISAVVDELFDAQLKLATGNEKRPPDGRAIDSMLDRVFGKSQENLDLTTNGKDMPTPILGGISKT